MTNFDDDIRRISVLVNDLGDGRDGDAWDRCRVVLEAAGKVDKERFIEGIDEANQFGRLHRNVMSGYGLFIEDLEEIAAALPGKGKEKKDA